MQGATFLSSSCLYSLDNFNPRSLCRERPIPDEPYTVVDIFQSTLPMQGATKEQGIETATPNISIHAPYAGSDWKHITRLPGVMNFNPRSLCRERQIICVTVYRLQNFNPRSLCRERPASIFPEIIFWIFQSTLPMQGATFSRATCVPLFTCISIHAPYAGSDVL